MKAGTRWFAVFVAAMVWTAACVITWQMPVATRDSAVVEEIVLKPISGRL